jgi:hypothetical protein
MEIAKLNTINKRVDNGCKDCIYYFCSSIRIQPSNRYLDFLYDEADNVTGLTPPTIVLCMNCLPAK